MPAESTALGFSPTALSLRPKLVLNTTQYTFEFYQKFGFNITKITKDYYRVGLDRYDMIKYQNLSI